MQPATEEVSSGAPAYPAPAESPVVAQQYLTFQLGPELFAVGILAVKEIIQLGTITTVPLMPTCIRGVINLRGAVVPVMDLRARLGLGTTCPSRKNCVVIVEMTLTQETLLLGLMVDTVSAVLRISPDVIEDAPHFGMGIRPEFIRGIAQLKQFVVMLDLGQVVAIPELDDLSSSGADATDQGDHVSH